MDVSGRAINGDGSVYQRSFDGRWIGAVVTGYRQDGRPIRKTVSAKTKAEAVKALRQLQRQIDDGLPPPDNRLTVQEVLDSWIANALPVSVGKATEENYTSIVRNHLVPGLGRKRVKALEVDDVDAFLKGKLADGLSPRTVRLIRTVLVLALGDAVRRGKAVRNVASLTKPPKEQARRPSRSMTIDQARRLLDALRGQDHEALYIFMLSTGVRPGEALGLPWRNVDLGRGTVSIHQALSRSRGGNIISDGKTHKKGWRTIELPPTALAALQAQQRGQAEAKEKAGDVWRETGLVFTTPIGTALDPDNQRKMFTKLVKAAGLGHWHPHELRHSAGSIMLASGTPIEVVSKILGHSSIRVTVDIYGHLLKPQQNAAAKAMEAVLWGSDEQERSA